ncbi:MAG: CDP-alcohol phosphatidyltransferase family protein [Bacteroidota bacterium]
MKKHIPNALTLLNLLCGCVALYFVFQNKMELAALLVFLGVCFDFLDGFAARLLNVQSALGLQLDSLADMVTSGVVPGAVMFQLLRMSKLGGWNEGISDGLLGWSQGSIELFPFLGFLITLGSAYRLANFNIDSSQTTSFVGLPTPANTLLILSLPLILLYQNNTFLAELILNPYFLIAVTLLSTFLLNARIRLFALKFKHWGFKGNEIRYLFLILCVVLLITLKFLAIPVLIVCYVIMSLLGNGPEA